MEDSKSENFLKIYVNNLEQGVTEEKLISYFSTFGPVRSCQLSMFSKGNMKGCAVIEVDDQLTKEKIFRTLHVLGSKKINVTNYSKSKWTYKQRKLKITGIPSYLKMDEICEFFTRFGKIEYASRLQSGRAFLVFSKIYEVELVLGSSIYEVKGVELSVNGYLNRGSNPKIFDPQINQRSPRVYESTEKREFLQLPKIRPQDHACNQNKFSSYFKGEFLPPKKLQVYLQKIKRKNTQIKFIPKKKIKTLELFYHNKVRRGRLDNCVGVLSYYTMVKRINERIEQNHNLGNLRWNEGNIFGRIWKPQE